MRPERPVLFDSGDPRPLLLVDVDGVLNPWHPLECPPGFREYSFFPGERVLLAEGHGALLRDLAESFEIVWATAWEHRANRLICPVIKLPELPVIEFPLAGTDFFFRKLPAVIESVGDRPCAWIDDEHHPEHHDWARQRGVPTLIVDIDPAVGLTTRVAEELLQWAAGLRDQADNPD